MEESQLQSLIGQEGMLFLAPTLDRKIGVRVVITDVKKGYFLVRAKDGDGSTVWVDSYRVVLA